MPAKLASQKWNGGRDLNVAVLGSSLAFSIVGVSNSGGAADRAVVRKEASYWDILPALFASVL